MQRSARPGAKRTRRARGNEELKTSTESFPAVQAYLHGESKMAPGRLSRLAAGGARGGAGGEVSTLAIRPIRAFEHVAETLPVHNDARLEFPWNRHVDTMRFHVPPPSSSRYVPRLYYFHWSRRLEGVKGAYLVVPAFCFADRINPADPLFSAPDASVTGFAPMLAP